MKTTTQKQINDSDANYVDPKSGQPLNKAAVACITFLTYLGVGALALSIISLALMRFIFLLKLIF